MLEDIKKRWVLDLERPNGYFGQDRDDDMRWLIAEVERLRSDVVECCKECKSAQLISHIPDCDVRSCQFHKYGLYLEAVSPRKD